MYLCRARLDSEGAARRQDPKPESFIYLRKAKPSEDKGSEKTALATPRLCSEPPQQQRGGSELKAKPTRAERKKPSPHSNSEEARLTYKQMVKLKLTYNLFLSQQIPLLKNALPQITCIPIPPLSP